MSPLVTAPASAMVDHQRVLPSRSRTSTYNPNHHSSVIFHRIYDYAVGGGTIHIRERRCSSHDNYHRHQRGRPRFGSWAGREGEVYYKLTYAVCQIPHEWLWYCNRNRCRREGHPPYSQNHYTKCIRRPLNDFWRASLSREIDSVVCGEGEAGQDGSNQLHSQRLMSVKKRHARSALDLALLRTCRLMYHETWNLVFINYSFDVALNCIPEFATNSLQPFQAAAVWSLHLQDVYSIERLYEAVTCFPNLRRLELSHWHRHFISGKRWMWEEFFRISKLESVEVLVDCSRDSCIHEVSVYAVLLEFLLEKRGSLDDAGILERLEMGVEEQLCKVDGL